MHVEFKASNILTSFLCGYLSQDPQKLLRDFIVYTTNFARVQPATFLTYLTVSVKEAIMAIHKLW